MFGEAESLEDGIAFFAKNNKPIDPDTIKIGEKVKWNGKENEFGVDWEAILKTGEPLAVESKVAGSSC